MRYGPHRKTLLGKMMKGKHGRADITPETLFRVKYLGSTRTLEPGLTAIHTAVEKIKREANQAVKMCPKVALEVTTDGISFKEVKKDKGSRFIPIDTISFGAPATDALDLTNVFAFNHHISKSPLVVECHAVLCESEETSKAIGLALYSAFREEHFRNLRRERGRSSESSTMSLKSPSPEPHREKELYKKSAPSEKTECTLNKNKPVDTENYMSPIDIDHDEKELDNIIRDLLTTVEREAAKLEQGRNE